LDGQGNCNQTRKAAALQLAVGFPGNPTGTGEARILILGDMNAYAQEDPIVALKAGWLCGSDSTHFGSAGYSYAFDGQWGYLDHALAARACSVKWRACSSGTSNADEPTVLDYNTEFKSAGQVSGLYSADAYRASDHDPVIVRSESRAPPSPRCAREWLRYNLALGLLLGACGGWDFVGFRRARARDSRAEPRSGPHGLDRRQARRAHRRKESAH